MPTTTCVTRSAEHSISTRMPQHLRPPIRMSLGPANVALDPRHLLQRLLCGQSGHQRQQRGAGRRAVRSQHDRKVHSLTGLGVPLAPQPAPAGSLAVRAHGRPLGAASERELSGDPHGRVHRRVTVDCPTEACGPLPAIAGRSTGCGSAHRRRSGTVGASLRGSQRRSERMTSACSPVPARLESSSGSLLWS